MGNPTNTENGKSASSERSLDASKLIITKTDEPNPIPEPGSAELWEQNACCDHMVIARWSVGQGWEAPELKPYGDISISPAASCLHYATQCFEEMKVYRGFDGWLPKDKPGSFLYIRPAVIGTGRQIGVQILAETTLIILMVAWSDFASETPPGAPPKQPGLRLLTSETGSARAWPGGFRYARISANYEPSFLSPGECRKEGYDQILWVLGPDSHITKAGASNSFVLIKNPNTRRAELITPPLDDKIILEGINRQSVLDLARSRLSDHIDVVETKFTMGDLQVAWNEGRLLEAFVSGTAFFISPVSVIGF